MSRNCKTYLVIGTGKSGIADVGLLSRCTAGDIVLFEGNAKADPAAIKDKLPEDCECRIFIGDLPENVKDKVDICVLSPGVPVDSPLVEELESRNVKIIGELELGYLYKKGKVAAITGTNGKTTTTSLTGAIMKEYYRSVFVAGNIGTPFTEVADKTDDSSVSVIEVSSFMLETIHKFHPEVSAVLNITPDHLNRHHTMENYVAAKLHIAMNQDKDQICVLNYDDPYLRAHVKDIPCRIFWFSSTEILKEGIFIDGEDIMYIEHEGYAPLKICGIHDMKLLGRHNHENVMAAAAIAMHMGVPVECIRRAIADFNAVEHRIEYVRTFNGVKYYNDSKGTNPDAAIKAVGAMETPTVLIGGGYDKGSTFDEWIGSFGDKVKYLVLMGDTADKIEKCALDHGFTDIIRVNSLEEAVKVSKEKAENGWSVLLSPACASWDMFKSFEERGDLFKKYVNELK
ncbi:MAG: UDP-N-acetylmuramoyl-L-alanine--D-glutamate ligase [Lachnospiraceae bacterium]|jgi:UDP-N-acetylmuramoylalanine--D-glutamate ligase|nr:UDP-N-acetylmuramoyl-L-alanine--D-glutamate ligase [Lachnospiraceae bacterium]